MATEERTGIKPPPLTTENVNRWLATVLTHPDRAEDLAEDPRAILLANFETTHEQREHIRTIPEAEIAKVRDAIGVVQRRHGQVRVEREHEHAPGRLVMEFPTQSVEQSMEPEVRLTIIIAHCSFDANCSDWSCGWGP